MNGYSNLDFAPNVNWQRVSPTLLQNLNIIMRRLGKTALIISGYRTPAHSVAVGGFANDPHTKGIAVDATVNGQPIGYVTGFVQAANSIGLISGNQPNFYKGQPDPGHVQLGGGMTVATQTQPNIPAPTPSPHDPPGFAQLLLQKLGIQPTQAKVTFLNWWFDNEGNNGPPGNNGVNNPLNVSPGGSVANYNSPDEGATATAAVLQQSNFSQILAAFQNPNATGAQLAAAVETSPWASSHYGAYDSQGNYVGGHLIQPYLPANRSPGTLASILGQVGHYTVHPVAGLQATASAGEKAALSGLSDTAKYVLYGVAMLGGALILITGFILIGADIGLATTRNRKMQSIIIQPVKKRIGGRESETQEERDNRQLRDLEREERIRRSRARTRYDVNRARIQREKANKLQRQAARNRNPGELPAGY